MFFTSDMEESIQLLLVHETIFSDLKLNDQVRAIKALVNIIKSNLVKFNKPNSRASAADKYVSIYFHVLVFPTHAPPEEVSRESVFTLGSERWYVSEWMFTISDK